MAEDYLVRSGAKELLARAVASLLEIHPANQVQFLAHRFDTAASSAERSARLLQACPPHGAAFEDALFQAFRWLSTTGASRASEPSLIETLGLSVTSTVSRSSYELLLARLSAEFPVHVKDRVLDALHASIASSGDKGKDVSMDEFQRGVRVCTLVEELFDVVDELFYSIDKGGFGKVKLAVVLSALENAAQQQQQQQLGASDLDGSALAVLRTHLRSRHEIPGLNASNTLDDTGTPSISGSAGDRVPLASNDDETHRSVRLVDLQEIVFHAVFSP